MDQVRAFLNAIRDDPVDDAPRLIFADWYEDQGQPERAALLRAQVRLASLSEEHPDRPGLEDEADDLLAQHEAAWAVPVNYTALEWGWRRGLIEQATLSAEAFVEQGEELLTGSLVREVRLLGGPGELRSAMRTPHLAALDTLDLDCRIGGPSAFRVAYFRDNDLLPLATSSHLTRLRSLNVAGQGIEGPFTNAMVESGLFDRLERLALNGNKGLGDRVVRRLVESSARNLTELDLRGCNLTPYGVRNLFRAGRWPRLQRLRVPVGEVLARSPDPVAMLRELLSSPLWAHLTNLELLGWSVRSPLPSGVVRELVESPTLARLRELDFLGCHIDADSLQMLARSTQVSGLRQLDLNQGKAGVEGAGALATSLSLTGLRELRLADNDLGDGGLRALVEGPLLARLTRLDVGHNRIAGPGLKALLSSPAPSLHALLLPGNFIGASGAELLASSSLLAGLTHLDLDRCNLGPAGARALAASPAVARLRVLSLRHNRLGDEGVQALASSPHLARLRSLHLDGNDLDSPSAQALLDSPYLDRLRQLSLRNAQFGYTEQERVRARFGEGVIF